MRTEIHMHGYLELVEGVVRRQVEGALRPLLDYLDVEHLTELKSLEPDQPGFVFDDRNWTLEICCTLEVGRNFHPALETAMQALGRLVEQADAIEVITYRDDGDDSRLLFVGPTRAAIRDAQRRQLLGETGELLAQQLSQPSVDQVLRLIDELFRRESAAQASGEPESLPVAEVPSASGRRRLH